MIIQSQLPTIIMNLTANVRIMHAKFVYEDVAQCGSQNVLKLIKFYAKARLCVRVTNISKQIMLNTSPSSSTCAAALRQAYSGIRNVFGFPINLVVDN